MTIRTGRTVTAIIGGSLAVAMAAACGTRLPDRAFAPQVISVRADDPSLGQTSGAPPRTQPATTDLAVSEPVAGDGTSAASPAPVTISDAPVTPPTVNPVAGATLPTAPATHSAAAGPSAVSGPLTASDRGVTPTTITIGNIVTVGGVAGPDQFSVSRPGVQAYVNALNAKGGILGRQVKLLTCTDSSGTTDGASACVRQLIDQDQIFAFVGNNMFAYGGADYVNSQNVPDIGGQPIDKVYYQYPHLYNMYGSATVRDGTHLGDNGTNYGTDDFALWMKQNLSISKVGVVYYDQASSQYGASSIGKNFEVAGIPTKLYAVNLGLPNFASTVAQMQNDGVDTVADALDVNGNQKLCQAIESNGSFVKSLKAKMSTISVWTQQIGNQFSGTPQCLAKTFSTGYSDNYADSSNPEVARFQAAMNKYYPSYSGKIAQWTLEGWAAADWFTSAATSCGDTLTRVCVEHWLDTQPSLTAHGIMRPSVTFVRKTQAQATAVQTICPSIVQWDPSKSTWATRADAHSSCLQAQGYAYSLS